MHVENAFKGSQPAFIGFPFFGHSSHKLKRCGTGNKEAVATFSLNFAHTRARATWTVKDSIIVFLCAVEAVQVLWYSLIPSTDTSS